MIRRPPRSTLFPYTRSSDLFRGAYMIKNTPRRQSRAPATSHRSGFCPSIHHPQSREREMKIPPDRKSTRLNSSHSQISYAVFCLKKKKPPYTTTETTIKKQT